MRRAFSSGATIQRREVLHAAVWLKSPVTVVADDGDELAVLGQQKVSRRRRHLGGSHVSPRGSTGRSRTSHGSRP